MGKVKKGNDGFKRPAICAYALQPFSRSKIGPVLGREQVWDADFKCGPRKHTLLNIVFNGRTFESCWRPISNMSVTRREFSAH